MMAKILLVEDEINIASFIERGLQEFGHEVRVANDGQAGWELVQQEDFQLLILDIIMPKMNGLQLCKQYRQTYGYQSPVIMLTALGTTDDIVNGLDVGADDYLVKPFALEELHARIRALLRRHNNQGESELIVGNLTLNMGRRQVWMGGEELILTPKEYALLSRLMLKAGSPVHREILYNDIYNWDNEPSTNTLEVHIHNLRDKVGKARIRTVRGFGYMLVANEEN